MGLNRLIGEQNKEHAIRFFDLRRLFEMSYISKAAAPAGNSMGPEATMIFDNSTYAYEALPAEVLPAPVDMSTTRDKMNTNTARPPAVPLYWIVAMRLALVSFMTSAWFLSRSYTTTMYLVLGLATATIALQPSKSKSTDRDHWIFATIILEVVMIVLIYGLVRLRH
jgi:hypothetical protein